MTSTNKPQEIARFQEEWYQESLLALESEEKNGDKVRGIKVFVPDEDISRRVQEKLFEYEVEWMGGAKTPRNLCSPFLFISGAKMMTHTGRSDKRYFDEQPEEEVYYQDILNDFQS